MPKTSPAIHTPETLQTVIKEIADASAGIRSATEAFVAAKLDKVRVETGQAELKRALAGLMNFGMHLERAIYKAKQERGDFGVEVEEPARKNGRKKKP